VREVTGVLYLSGESFDQVIIRQPGRVQDSPLIEDCVVLLFTFRSHVLGVHSLRNSLTRDFR
jgi:hypothetical protein